MKVRHLSAKYILSAIILLCISSNVYAESGLTKLFKYFGYNNSSSSDSLQTPLLNKTHKNYDSTSSSSDDEDDTASTSQGTHTRQSQSLPKNGFISKLFSTGTSQPKPLRKSKSDELARASTSAAGLRKSKSDSSKVELPKVLQEVVKRDRFPFYDLQKEIPDYNPQQLKATADYLLTTDSEGNNAYHYLLKDWIENNVGDPHRTDQWLMECIYALDRRAKELGVAPEQSYKEQFCYHRNKEGQTPSEVAEKLCEAKGGGDIGDYRNPCILAPLFLITKHNIPFKNQTLLADMLYFFNKNDFEEERETDLHRNRFMKDCIKTTEIDKHGGENLIKLIKPEMTRTMRDRFGKNPLKDYSFAENFKYKFVYPYNEYWGEQQKLKQKHERELLKKLTAKKQALKKASSPPRDNLLRRAAINNALAKKAVIE